MKKRLIFSLMALMMLSMLVVSCGKDDDDDSQPNTTTQTSTETSEENHTEVSDDKTTTVDTETIKDSNGDPIGTRTTTTTTVNGESTVEVVLKDISGNVIDNDAMFTVKYNVAAGITGTIPAAQTGKFGDKITLAEQGDLSNGDWEFGGWNTKTDGSGKTDGSRFHIYNHRKRGFASNMGHQLLLRNPI